MPLHATLLKELALAAGFELAGVTSAEPLAADFDHFQNWCDAGFGGEMSYLTDHRGDLRADPRSLLPSAKSILCLGKLYNTNHGHSDDRSIGRISRYAWGQDYHSILRECAERMLLAIRHHHADPFEYRICVDTAPLLERSYAREAGLGWIGKNTCLINQQSGSWFLLAEILLSIPLTVDSPAAHRCGTCTRCVAACPTDAIRLAQGGTWSVDSRLCISYLTIEKRGPAQASASQTNHVFGCDICQDVCPWNRRAPYTNDIDFAPISDSPHLADLARLSEDDFRRLFRRSPIWRSKYEGFLRNVALALGNSGNSEMKQPLQKLAAHPNAVVSSSALSALAHLEETLAH